MRGTTFALLMMVMVTALPSARAETDLDTQAGVAGAVRGSVQIATAEYAARQRPIGQDIRSGTSLFLGDRLVTGANAGLQVMLMDQTTLTLGADAKMTIDKLVYDPASSRGKLTLTVVSGAFRFVSGKIAQNNPADVTINMPAATIGIRGTILGGNITPTGGIVALFGPGPSNDAHARPGAIDVTASGVTVSITRANFVTELLPGQPPSQPHLATPQQLQQIGLSSVPIKLQQPTIQTAVAQPAATAIATSTLPTSNSSAATATASATASTSSSTQQTIAATTPSTTETIAGTASASTAQPSQAAAATTMATIIPVSTLPPGSALPTSGVLVAATTNLIAPIATTLNNVTANTGAGTTASQNSCISGEASNTCKTSTSDRPFVKRHN
jgi:hypothetical protein